MTAFQRVVVRYSGRVQGVGFRQTSLEIARGFAVTGTVQNLPGGDVELIAEAEVGELEAFLAEIERRMGRLIQKVVRRPEPATQSFCGFSVLG